jgi:hypothetical protein
VDIPASYTEADPRTTAPTDDRRITVGPGADHYHAVEPELSWPLVPLVRVSRLSLEAGYELSLLDHRDDHTGTITGHIANIGLAGSF